jgi:glycosyltransferase involved in cell wall biosynthesis
MALVSIVLPVLNGGRYLAASLASCLRQTHADIEVIVVDGGSTDGSLDVIATHRDPRVTVLHQANNDGRLPGALNLGFAHAAGDYFTWTQADDVYDPDAIATLHAYLAAHPAVGFAYSGIRFVDADGAVLREYCPDPPDRLYDTNPIGHCFLYRRAVAASVGAYDPAYVMAEDAHYWMRVYRRFRMGRVPTLHYSHRYHPDSLSVRRYGAYSSLRVAARARRTVLGIGWTAYQRQIGAAYVEEAFAAHARGDAAHIRRCIWRGIARDPTWCRNRGVLSLALQSIGLRRVRSGSVQSSASGPPAVDR